MKSRVERFTRPGLPESRDGDAASGGGGSQGPAQPEERGATSSRRPLGDLVHDLRSPLGAIANLMAILEEDHAGRLDTGGRELLRRVAMSAERALALLDRSLEDSPPADAPTPVAWESEVEAGGRHPRPGPDGSDGEATADLPEILLVEDDPLEVSVALQAFRRHGLEGRVALARDGEAALSRLWRAAVGGSLPRVVFLDLCMPRVDGWGVLEALRSEPRTRHLPVVVVSSSRRPQDVREAYHRGANSFLRKEGHPGGGGGSGGEGDSRRARGQPGDALVEAARYWLERNEACP